MLGIGILWWFFPWAVPLLNLPRFFGTNFDKIPAEIPYLQAPQGVAAPTIHRPAGTKLEIGLVWASKPSHNNDKNRSTSLEKFLCLADIPGVALFSLAFAGVGKNLPGTGEFHKAPKIEKSRHVGAAAGLLHVVGDDHDGVIGF